MLELAVLGLLKEKPMYGYELKKTLDERLGHAWKFSPGSLYPTLRRLSKADAIEIEEPKTISRRSRKIYHLTPQGEQLFEQIIEETGPHDTEDREAFMMRLAFFRYTRPETRRRLLERRRGYLLEQLDRIKASLKNLKERVDAYSLELMRYGESETEHEIRWLDSRLEAEALEESRKQKKRARRAARERRKTVRRSTRDDGDVTGAPPVEPTRHPAVERG